MKYRLNIGQFCSLSQELKFQAWLSEVAYDLYELILNNSKGNASCKTNTKTMMEIQKILTVRKLDSVLINFLKSEYPIVLIEEDSSPLPKEIERTKILHSIKYPDPVFTYYNPGLLTFPQKIIFEHSNKSELSKFVKRFLMDKLGSDHVIVGNRAYIEYFKYKYRAEIESISPSDREIYKYKLKQGIIK